MKNHVLIVLNMFDDENHDIYRVVLPRGNPKHEMSAMAWFQLANQCFIKREAFANKLPDLVILKPGQEIVVFKPRDFKLGPKHTGEDRQVRKKCV